MLCRCLDSIPHREDVEIIVIDDNSDGSIVDFSDFPGVNDPFTKVVFDKTDNGPGYARNIALQIAKGDWVLFADADDYYITENLLLLMDYCMSCEEDLICCANKKTTIDKDEKYESFGMPITQELNIVNIKDKSIFHIDGHQSWKRVVRASLIKECNAHFRNIRYCEDLAFVTKITKSSKNTSVCTLPIYCYIKRNDSVTVNRALPDLIDAMNESIVINSQYKKWGYSQRLSVRIHLLMLLFQENKFIFVRMILKEIVSLGYSEAIYDYRYVCLHFGVNPNPLVATVDFLRVKLGVVRKAICNCLRRNLSS